MLLQAGKLAGKHGLERSSIGARLETVLAVWSVIAEIAERRRRRAAER